MEQTLANLADMVIQQYHEMPLAVKRVPLNSDRLAEVLKQATGFNHKKRMQFAISGKEEDNTFSEMDGSGKLVVGSFCPKRIFANYNTDYRPDRYVVGPWQRSQEEKFDNGAVDKSYAEVCCRLMRRVPEIKEIRRRSLEAGNKYGVMVQLTEDLSIIDGPPYYGGDQRVVLPLFFVPGASKEDLDTLARFSITLQKPSQEEVGGYLKSFIFEKRLYN